MTQPSETAAARAEVLAARVTFVIITALPKEYAAMEAMLDAPVPFNAGGRGATHDYLLGEIPAKGGGTHAVAVLLADQGNPAAAVYSASAVNNFADLNAVIMVGIAGGVPQPAKAEDHVRLGDLVVSGKGGVVQYDFGKEYPNRFEPKPAPRPPSAELFAAARRLDAYALSGRRPWERYAQRGSHLGKRPEAEMDRLAATDDPSTWVAHPEDPQRRVGFPRIFHGTIGAADRLQRNAAHRDALRDQFGIKALEMEGAGVAEAAWQLACEFFVVRGICDYCDENKNDLWQEYAAVSAAAYARALLEETAATERSVSERGAGPTPLTGDPSAHDDSTHRAFGQQRAAGLSVGLLDANPLLEAEHNAHLDGARELLKKGHARLARDDLEALKTRIWSGASAAVRARVVTLIGQAEFELGHFDAAGRSLTSALEHAPSDPKTQANAALGHALLGNVAASKEWAQEALVADPTNIIARQVLIHHDLRDEGSILAEHEAVVGRRTEVYFALGMRAGRAGDSTRAAEWFRKAAKLETLDADVLASAGQSILGIVTGRLDEAFGVMELTAEDRQRVSEAVELLERAWSELKDDEVRIAHVEWLVSLSHARRLQDDLDGAVTASEEALRLAGSTRRLIFVRAALAADAKDYKRIVELLDGKTENDAEILGLLAMAKSNLKDAAAIDLWKELLKLDLSRDGREQAERNLVLTLLEAGRDADARTAVVEFLQEGVTFERQLLASEVANRMADASLGGKHLQAALDLATHETPRRLLLRLGDALLGAGRHGDAADVYERSAQPEVSETDARRLLTALYRAGRFPKALAACAQIESVRGATRLSTEVQAVIKEQLGDLPGAKAVCAAHLEAHPKDGAVLLRLAKVLVRSGERSALPEVLDRIAVADVIGDIQLGALYVDLLVEAGRKKEAVEALYAIRRKHINDPQAHMLYIARHLVLGRALAEPTAIGSDVSVRRWTRSAASRSVVV